MTIPPLDQFGVRQTVNANLSTAQTVWNLRSAMNVAALNCLRPGDEPILDAYKDLLKSFAKPLSATNRALDAEFRKKYGAEAHSVRDQYMTQVYNYFALPPTLGDFCDEALQISKDYLAARPGNLDVYAANTLPKFENTFVNFFGAYERWRVNVAAWDAQYGEKYGHIYPAYVEAHRATPQFASNIEIAGEPVPATGAAVIDAPADPINGPIVQSAGGEAGEVETQPGFSGTAQTAQTVSHAVVQATGDSAGASQ